MTPSRAVLTAEPFHGGPTTGWRDLVAAVYAGSCSPDDWLVRVTDPRTGCRSVVLDSEAPLSNAWWDTEFAGVVPQLAGSGQAAALTSRIWRHCHAKYGLYMGKGERDALYRQWFSQVGQLVSDKISATSAETGMSVCDAAEAVLKPRRDSDLELVGWDRASFLSILYKQWQGGPIVGKWSGACAQGRLSLQFRRHFNGRHEGFYWPALGTPDATWPVIQGAERDAWVPAGVCLVWMPELGNAGVGASAVVTGFTYASTGDGVDFFNADNEVIACAWRAKNALGMPVTITPQADLSTPFTITAAQAGTWSGMSNCAWRLTPGDGSAPVEWNPGSRAFTSVELRAGDQFATTCFMRKDDVYHFPVIPDGLFPLEGPLAPGLRKPATPATCRFAIVDRTALRQPNATPLAKWAGQEVRGFPQSPDDGSSKYVHSQECGYWDL